MIEKKFRKNAGVVLFNQAGKVLVCRRIHHKKADGWQFPQGGIEENETAVEAAQRELAEETGVTSVEFVAQIEEPLRYEFPAIVLKRFKKIGRDFAGQDQYWSLFYFCGDNSEINLRSHPEEIEFDQWEWTDLESTPDKVWSIKKEVYQQMVKIFAPIIKDCIKKRKGTN